MIVNGELPPHPALSPEGERAAGGVRVIGDYRRMRSEASGF